MNVAPLRKGGFYLDYFLRVKVTAGAVDQRGAWRVHSFLLSFLKLAKFLAIHVSHFINVCGVMLITCRSALF